MRIGSVRNTIEYICKKNIFVIIFVILLCPILAVSYSSFIVNTENYRASEMFIGKLLYSIKINGTSRNTLTVIPGDTEATIEVTSLNTVSSNYKVVYGTNSSINIIYAEDENEPTYGLITNTKTSTILLTNTSENNITITFDIVGGYTTDELTNIIPNSGYTEVSSNYLKYDINTITMYIDGARVTGLDSTKLYDLLSTSSCINSETITWDNSTKTISISPLTNQTKCQLYFNERTLPTLTEKILADNTAYADNVASTYVTSATGIDFAAISSDTNGKGLYYTIDTSKTENGERVYYYRGAVTNNYLIFGGFCWRIVRTNEDGSVKLRYNGSPTSGVCPQTGTDVSIGSSKFNTTYNDNAHVGYMYGATGSSTYALTHTNTNNSIIKGVIDTWYQTNLSSYASYIADTPYCNDRSIGASGTVGGTVYTSNGFGTSNTLYGSTRRLATGGSTGTTWSGTNASPQYKCPQDNDKFTVSNTNGNGSLTYSIGLLTADEVAYAGGVYATTNSTYYLYTRQYYWTMSPFYFYSGYSNVFYVSSAGYLNGINVNYSGRVAPAVSLTSGTLVQSGTGAYNSPYVVN